MTDHSDSIVRVLFVCLGNICRSPTAEGVFRAQVTAAGLEHRVQIDSAGTAAYHLGKAPDARARAAARERGYHLDDLRARQVVPADFQHFDYVLAMDGQNLADLHRVWEANAKKGPKPRLFLSFAAAGINTRDVPDPYYGGDQGFSDVLDLCESGAAGLLADIKAQLHNGTALL